MKISNETRVGILTVVALTILILGYNFLKGRNFFENSKKIYASFSTIGTLDKSNDVKVKGKTVGKVFDTKFTDDKASGIVVTINLTSDIIIPKNSVAYIQSPITGSPYITIRLGDSAVAMKNGDTLMTMESDIFKDITSQVNPTLEKARTAIDSLTGVLGSINKFLDPTTKNNIHTVIENLVKSSASLAQLLSTENGMLAHSLANMNDVTANLKKNNDTITDIIHNTKVVTAKLADLNLQKVVDSLESAAGEMKQVIYKINHNTGTLGMLMNDRALYDNLQKTVLGLEILIDDIRVHPKRYVNFSIFGKKDKGDYLILPASKDSSKKNN
jgi:phospholipid/cholesterol/gamma-HCH transport system substrate-binding protein